MYTIAKTFEFDAGHRLAKGYEGKCANLHGHRYRVEIALKAKKLNDFDMVFDFNDMDPIKQWLDDEFDHKMMLWICDPLIEGFRGEDDFTVAEVEESFQLKLMDHNPTAEYMARHIYEEMGTQVELPSKVKVAYVKVWETPKCWAKYSEEG